MGVGRVLSDEDIQTIEQNIDGPAQVISALIATIRDRDKTIAECRRYVSKSNYDSEQIAIRNVRLEYENDIFRESLERIKDCPHEGLEDYVRFVDSISCEALAKVKRE